MGSLGNQLSMQEYAVLILWMGKLNQQEIILLMFQPFSQQIIVNLLVPEITTDLKDLFNDEKTEKKIWEKWKYQVSIKIIMLF